MDYVDKSIFAAFSTFCLRESKGHPNAVPILDRVANATNPEVFKLMMQITVLLLVQYYLCFTLPFCCAIVYVVQKVYLRTSRQLRIIEIESRSQLYSSFLETVWASSKTMAYLT